MEVAIHLLVEYFQKVKDSSKKYAKPVIFAAEFPLVQGSLRFQLKTMRALSRKDMICYRLPDEAAMVLSSMVRYKQFLLTHQDIETC